MATAPPQADAALVRRLRERDRTAWEELYDEYGLRLRAFAYRLTGNPHDADDLVQETFVRALPRLDRLDPGTVDLGPYLFTTLRNLFLKSVERRRRAEPVADLPEPDGPRPIEDDPERSTLLRRQLEEVRVANGRLAPRQRLVLALRELEDRSYAEIGVIVGLNENAVAQLLARARESLRLELRLAQTDPSRLPDECRRNLPLLSRHLDGQLRGARLDSTLAHLESCERCQAALDSMREASRRYRLLPPLLWAGEDLRDGIDAALARAGYWSGRARRLARLGRRGAVVAVGVALVAAGGAGVGAAVLLVGEESEPAVAAVSATVRPVPAEATTTLAGRVPPASRPASTTKRAPTTTVTQAAGEATAAAATTAPPATSTTTTTTAEPVKPTKPAAQPPKTTTTRATVHPATTARVAPPAPADRTAPTVTILARPPAETASTSATFSFRASEAGARFSCRLDGGAYAACTSPHTSTNLGVGAHTFAVRARDGAGNVGAPASAAWSVLPPPDTTAPTVSIVSAATPGSDAAFEFSASEPGSAFACSLDNAGFESCSSPRAYAGLVPGAHTFAVRATDPAGNTGDAATHSWTVAPPPPPPPPALPDLVVSALTKSGFVVTNTGPAAAGAFVVSVTLIGTFSVPGIAPGASASRTWSTCRVGTITAIADRGADVPESDESNNTRAVVSTC